MSPEQPGSSIVRVKKLFPGQPAAESGQIEVGDVILKVNGASLKGLSQQVSMAFVVGIAGWNYSGKRSVLYFNALVRLCRKSSQLSGEHQLKSPSSSAGHFRGYFQKSILLYW